MLRSMYNFLQYLSRYLPQEYEGSLVDLRRLLAWQCKVEHVKVIQTVYKKLTSTVSEELCCLDMTFGLAVQSSRKRGITCSTNIVKYKQKLAACKQLLSIFAARNNAVTSINGVK
eukprot:9612952-Ditylum_brightwellii.AAC.1